MITIDYSTAQNNLKKYCDAAVQDSETIIVTREQGANVVIISEAEYNNLVENLYVRNNKIDYERLHKSIDQLRHGHGKKQKLVEDE